MNQVSKVKNESESVGLQNKLDSMGIGFLSYH